ncbi:hypothetical protein [Stenotrophomonas sp. MMGLT7]|uniref:hypothetical protein n=1 Tax=Stenotrophomonas sp. MMGLT7 TaxID=2901227 RepID=UPI001E2B3A20|nr:hypothetical protein [Stenotrophomonas sp. MMGLT7]MCD7099096.1 hypothetical protein [Stenotrophomonas sp. MMGLT7]
MKAPQPGLDLLLAVKAGFVRQGTTMTRWAKDNDTHVSNVRNALIGTWNGPRGQAMRTKIVRAAGVRDAV